MEELKKIELSQEAIEMINKCISLRIGGLKSYSCYCSKESSKVECNELIAKHKTLLNYLKSL